MTKAVEGFVKSVPLVWGLVVRLLVVPGVLRASVGVDCFVPCPPSVAPRTGFRSWGLGIFFGWCLFDGCAAPSGPILRGGSMTLGSFKSFGAGFRGISGSVWQLQEQLRRAIPAVRDVGLSTCFCTWDLRLLVGKEPTGRERHLVCMFVVELYVLVATHTSWLKWATEVASRVEGSASCNGSVFGPGEACHHSP